MGLTEVEHALELTHVFCDWLLNEHVRDCGSEEEVERLRHNARTVRTTVSSLSGTGVLIRATHHYGYRYGHSDPWGEIVGIYWREDRACYRVKFSDGVVDDWPVYDSSDPYEFRSVE